LVLLLDLLPDLLDFFAVPVVVFAEVLPVAGLCEVLCAAVVCAATTEGSVKLPTAIAARIRRVIRRFFCCVRMAG
jgi:hypothetical protein